MSFFSKTVTLSMSGNARKIFNVSSRRVTPAPLAILSVGFGT